MIDLVWFGSVRFGSVRFDSIWFDLIELPLLSTRPMVNVVQANEKLKNNGVLWKKCVFEFQFLCSFLLNSVLASVSVS